MQTQYLCIYDFGVALDLDAFDATQSAIIHYYTLLHAWRAGERDWRCREESSAVPIPQLLLDTEMYMLVWFNFFKTKTKELRSSLKTTGQFWLVWFLYPQLSSAALAQKHLSGHSWVRYLPGEVGVSCDVPQILVIKPFQQPWPFVFSLFISGEGVSVQIIIPCNYRGM